MKKIHVLFLFMAFFVLTSCGSNTSNNDKTPINRLTVQYFDEDNLISQTIYTEENFLLESYQKEDYEFAGWYLDNKFTTPFDETNLKEYFEMKVIALYAKMNKIMKSNNIEVKGLINNKAVLNPSFIWKNTNEDTSFKVELYNGSTLVWNKTVATCYVSVTNYLNADTTYTFKLTGLDSNYTDTISFETASYTASSSDISIDNPFMSNMVIQREQETIFSGKVGKFELITVNDGKDVYFGISDDKGNYEVKVPGKEANFTPSSITISNGMEKEIVLENVLYGDVYLFAGQSNMQWPTMNSDFIYDDVSRAKLGNVRYFSQDVVTSTSKLEQVKNGKWFIADSNNINYFSAIAFMSGSMLSNALKTEVPIGIITAYQGDTNIVNWMGSEYYSGNISTKYLHYNAMVYPLRHTKLSGVVWYQGCNNSASGGDYKDLLIKLFQNYRELFNSPNTPFFVIGLCCYDGDSGNNYDFSYVRESQMLACQEDEHAYFISTCDNGDPTYIHPKVKRYICERISKSIQSVVYGKNYLAEGPIYKSHTVNGNTVTIEFYNSDGLKQTGDITDLYLAGADGKYYEASATIQNETIVASSTSVQNPVYIKYGFSKSPFVNVFNKDNFAIAPFRTDDHNTNIDLLNYASLEDYYFHPDGSDMSVAYQNGNLLITKANDGKTYGSVRLDVWGMIAYLPEGFRFTLVGTNSNAAISFRIIEGSYEIWAYKVVDNFTGEKSFEISCEDFSVVYNKEDGILNTQKVIYIEIMVEAPGAASFEVKEARFVDIE